jgi:hypothetical protein
MKNLMLAAVLVVTGTGCATLNTAATSKGDGTANTYNKPYDAAWKAALETVRQTDLALVSEDKARGLILAQRGVTWGSPGESVAVFVESTEPGRTRIEVVRKKRWALNYGAPDWEKILLKKLDGRL